MGVSEKVVEALRAGILLNERVTTLIDKVNRMDQDIRHMNERLIRLETLVEIARMQPFNPKDRKLSRNYWPYSALFLYFPEQSVLPTVNRSGL
jgi:hypothetical protein